ncbi:MAG: adenylosuccinate synthase [bacterium]
MSVTAVVGANWGDEGKGKMTDYLAQKSDIVVRFQGGNNAGHTIINKFGKFALHLLPSGIFYPHVTNILGPGIALNIQAFFDELNSLLTRDIPKPKIYISNRAQILMPYHLLFDQLEEQRLADKKFGSTMSGIAPFYADKYHKIGISVSHLEHPEYLRERLESIIQPKNVILKHLYNHPPLSPQEIYQQLMSFKPQLDPLIVDTQKLFYQALKQNKSILIEGQLGALRDPDHGIYPYSTSSSPLAGYASVGAGIPPYQINQVIGVVKAYSTCVGAGPLVTELFGEQADQLRNKGGDSGEYGATTGRPRRVGWFDAVATRYGCRVQGATEVALTLVDVLGYLEEIKICTGYDIQGTVTDDFPATIHLDKAAPVYQSFQGWKEDISSIRDYKKLPTSCRDYVGFIQDYLGIPIKWISVGPHRENLIKI